MKRNNRKKITYIHNKGNIAKQETTFYYVSVEEFLEAMKYRKEKFYPHLEVEIVDVEDYEYQSTIKQCENG